MTVSKIDGKITIKLKRDEYLEYCKKANENRRSEYHYDLEEICYLEEDVTINEDMLDECDDGFYMWSDDFWILYQYAFGYRDPETIQDGTTIEL